MVIIYTKPGCPHCDKAKMFFESQGVDYIENILGRDVLVEEFRETFPDVKTVPLIFMDGVKIGGYTDLVEWARTRPRYLEG